MVWTINYTESARKQLALYEIQWVIIFHFPTKKINHVDKVLYVSIASSAPFG